ncbi:MAG: Glyoxalase/bleomycin resistance protein/dioxygenase [Acidimicrobiales bacterium]|nr:Glyoxalase/bleomycin resistance protein/dioxygenase [Acidimicrobiales bacterium]
MARPASTPLGAPCWADLFTTDADRAQEFYGQLLGWTAESTGDDYGGYINFSKDGLMVAGAMQKGPEISDPDVWTVYLATDDARATVDLAAEHGAQVIVPAMDVMELGTMAVLFDPAQAAVGAWQAGLHEGFGAIGRPGTANWFELHTREFDTAVSFYEQVFGWDAHVMSDSPEFRYTTLGEGDTARAGIMDASNFLPEGVPASWQIYFGVEDADAALAKVIELGGSVMQGAEDTPYGRMASVADPSGAFFKVVQPLD